MISTQNKWNSVSVKQQEQQQQKCDALYMVQASVKRASKESERNIFVLIRDFPRLRTCDLFMWFQIFFMWMLFFYTHN